MAGYFGTDTQQRLQAHAEASADFIAATPGACQAGRTMGCDDPDELGWDHIDAFLARDGVCGFRLIDTARIETLRSQLSDRGCRLDTWDVFVADREAALEIVGNIACQPLPDGLSELPMPTEPDGIQVQRLQAMMAQAGLVPFSGSMLTGAIGRATTVMVGDADGNVVASAHGYLPHNAHSPYHRYAWGGLVAVAEQHRGKGLGTWVNARMIERAFRQMDASHVYELVSASNIPSRRMVEACGLRLEPWLTCGIGTPLDNARFTK